MNGFEAWVYTPVVKALGWTLFHFVWEGALLALAAAVVLGVSRSARVRHITASVALAAMLASFGATFLMLMAPAAHAPSIPVRVVPLTPYEFPPDSGGAATAGSVADLLPWLAPFWMTGVLFFQVRAAAGWMGVRRLRRVGVCCATGAWQARLNALAARIRVSLPVKMLESSLAEVPLVAGYLRPVILMPVGLLAGLPSAQVDALLIHELAHIRRFDHLLSLLQTVAESLLFYHPAVWWISGRIRTERENCCDDWVVATTGDRHEYAVALAALEQNRSMAREAALAATGGSLVERIRRVLVRAEEPRTAPVMSAIALSLAAAITLTAWQTRTEQIPVPEPKIEAVSPFDKWLNEEAVYIIAPEERKAFQALRTDAERAHFIEQFWQRRDPTPATPENEFKQEHDRRISWANDRFATAAAPGWKTERGRTYIVYGPPDEIESHPSAGGNWGPPFEWWSYRTIPGVGRDVRINFVDRTASGDYRVTNRMQPAASGRFFSSVEPGGAATVEILPSGRFFVSLPLEFDAKEYKVTGEVSSSNFAIESMTFEQNVTLCKNLPAAAGCLDAPLFRIGDGEPGIFSLQKGAYVFAGTVDDAKGVMQKRYTVYFSVN